MLNNPSILIRLLMFWPEYFPSCLMSLITGTGLASGFEACKFNKYFLWLNIFLDKSDTSSDEVTSFRLTLIELAKEIFCQFFMMEYYHADILPGWRQYEARHEVKGICGIRIISFLFLSPPHTPSLPLTSVSETRLVSAGTPGVAWPWRNKGSLTDQKRCAENKRINSVLSTIIGEALKNIEFCKIILTSLKTSILGKV